jgi:hypothetical protein
MKRDVDKQFDMSDFLSGIRVDLLFPDDCTDFIAEIYFDNNLLCTVSQEKGLNHLDIEFENVQGRTITRVPLKEFQKALSHAVHRLHELKP